MVRGEHQDDVIGSLILPNRKGILGEIRCSVFIYAKMVITWVISYFAKRHKKPGKAKRLTQSLFFYFFFESAAVLSSAFFSSTLVTVASAFLASAAVLSSAFFSSTLVTVASAFLASAATSANGSQAGGS